MATPVSFEDTRARHYKNTVILTDFNCGISNAQIEMRFQSVFRYTVDQITSQGELIKKVSPHTWTEREISTRPPVVMNVNDIPFGNMDFAGYALYSTYRALGKSTRPNIFVHVTDPGVGDGEDRSILITDQDNIFIGPNNASLGLMASYFKSRNISYKLYSINQSIIEEIEQHRMESPTYQTPTTFHGRDLFAVTAGLIAGGVNPESLAKTDPDNHGHRAELPISHSIFGDTISQIPLEVGKSQHFHAFRDTTFGNLKTNISIDNKTLEDLISQSARFKVSKKRRFPWCWCPIKHTKLTFPVRHMFSESKLGSPLLYAGSTFSVHWDEHFVELALNMRNVSNRLGISTTGSEELIIERVR